jgi:hypothetical protein
VHPVRPRRHPFDRSDFPPIGLDCEQQAGTDRLTVEKNGAGAAHPMLASDMRPGQSKLVAQVIAQEQARLHLAGMAHAVDGDVDFVELEGHELLSGVRFRRRAARRPGWRGDPGRARWRWKAG